MNNKEKNTLHESAWNDFRCDCTCGSGTACDCVGDSGSVDCTLKLQYTEGILCYQLFPKGYTLHNYVRLFTDTQVLDFPQMFKNTFIIAVFSCLISTIFVLSVSYCMSRMRFKIRKTYMNIAMILGLFPAFMSMVAVYYILKAVGLSEDR